MIDAHTVAEPLDHLHQTPELLSEVRFRRLW